MSTQTVAQAAADLYYRIRDETEIGDFRPHRDRVLVKPLKDPGVRRSPGGLYLPAEGKDARHDRALVVAVGPGSLNHKTGDRISPDVKPGNLVVVGNAIGEPVYDDDVEYRLVRAGDILAVLEDEG